MTDEEIIEALATKVMGWKRTGNIWQQKDEMIDSHAIAFADNTYEQEGEAAWNPLVDWNHWRQIEEQLMEDGKSPLMKEYLRYFDGKGHYMGSDLRERADALIAALSASPQL